MQQEGKEVHGIIRATQKMDLINEVTWLEGILCISCVRGGSMLFL
jgi:hypothetical protein